MQITRALLAAFGCLAVATALHAQGTVVTNPGTATELVPLRNEGPYYPSKCWAERDPECSPCCYAYNHLAVPFDITLRTGPSFIIGGNRFDKLLETGIAIDFCARGFCYDVDYSAAWTVEMGIATIINPADESTPAIRRLNDVAVTGQFGQPIDTDVTSIYGVKKLNRVSVQLTGGREWYWFAPDCPGKRYLLGFDVGGRVGHAHALITLVSRTFDPPIGPNDEVIDRDRHHETDLYYGMFAGANAWVIYPCWGYDMLFGLRGEIGRDWVDIVDHDDTLDQAQLLFVAGLRF